MVIVILFSKSSVYANSAYFYMPIQPVLPVWYPIARDRDYSEQNYKDEYANKNSSTRDFIDHIYLVFVVIILINSLSVCVFMILRDVKNYFKKLSKVR